MCDLSIENVEIMNEVLIKINSIQDVGLLTEIALRNGYKVTSKPIYEAYWKQKIDHFEVTLELQSKEND